MTVALAILAIVTLGCAPSAPPAVEQAPSGASAGPPAEVLSVGVVYVGNEGFLVETAGKKILIDGLIGSLEGYVAVPPVLRSELEAEGDIAVALATHFHRDHFDPDSVARFLASNPEAVFVSTPQAYAKFAETVRGEPGQTLADRFQAVLPDEGSIERLDLNGVEIRVLNLHHGRRTPPVENLGFVIELGAASLLHFGDTEATMEDFEPYLDLLRDTDLALLPFWFLSSEWRAELVRDLIQPRWIVAGHTPTADADSSYFGRWESRANLVRSMVEAFPAAHVPELPGTAYEFTDH